MKFYENYPDYSRSVYLNFEKLLPEYECRVARLLVLWIKKFQDDYFKAPNLSKSGVIPLALAMGI